MLCDEQMTDQPVLEFYPQLPSPRPPHSTPLFIPWALQSIHHTQSSRSSYHQRHDEARLTVHRSGFTFDERADSDVITEWTRYIRLVCLQSVFSAGGGGGPGARDGEDGGEESIQSRRLGSLYHGGKSLVNFQPCKARMALASFLRVRELSTAYFN